jgi:hypothetical protein
MTFRQGGYAPKTVGERTSAGIGAYVDTPANRDPAAWECLRSFTRAPDS